jgi:hypothetical protein
MASNAQKRMQSPESSERLSAGPVISQSFQRSVTAQIQRPILEETAVATNVLLVPLDKGSPALGAHETGVVA